ncbi:hypothetical protein COE67_07375 [Priestia megaterium]|nr:hypothetical protein COI68_24485 [Priestia megaterium]PGK57826.1 hypothetical protein CN918_08045 [Priestia megaterium]PGX43277.1 hypothetical protein COE67_07375 [Priestia megaterium]
MIRKGNRRLTFDISEELHKDLHFLTLENNTSIMVYVKAILKKHVKKVRKVNKGRVLPLDRKHPM